MKFVNVCPVLISDNVQKTVDFYVEKLGFQYAKQYDKIEHFATLYRDSVELVVVQSKFGKAESNAAKYGAGFDMYIDPDTVDGVDEIYREYVSKGVKVIEEPKITEYGSYEFVVEDIDGRQIGIGRISDKKTYFQNSNYFS